MVPFLLPQGLFHLSVPALAAKLLPNSLLSHPTGQLGMTSIFFSVELQWGFQLLTKVPSVYNFPQLRQYWWVWGTIDLNPWKEKQLKTQQSQGDHFELEVELSFKFAKNLFIRGKDVCFLESTIKHEKCLMPEILKIISFLSEIFFLSSDIFLATRQSLFYLFHFQILLARVCIALEPNDETTNQSLKLNFLSNRRILRG